ncbi:MAG: methionyl-tRNA formyltransferase [Gammaproteobacteria bacterium]
MIFAGTPEFSAQILKALCNNGFYPQLVLTQPPRPSGRGQKLKPSPVALLAESLNLNLATPKSLKQNPEMVSMLSALKPEIMVVVAYGLILPQNILDIPKLGCINIHASLLPRYRGASPITASLLHADLTTGISLMQMDAGLDTGPVLYQAEIPIAPKETTGSLTEKLAKLSADSIVTQLPLILNQKLKTKAQDPNLASHAPKIQKQDAQLNWHEKTAILLRKIFAYQPWPIAYTNIPQSQQTIKIWDARAGSNNNQTQNPPGTVLKLSKQGLEIATSDGSIEILELQFPNENKISIADFLNNPNKLKLISIGSSWLEK